MPGPEMRAFIQWIEVASDGDVISMSDVLASQWLQRAWATENGDVPKLGYMRAEMAQVDAGVRGEELKIVANGLRVVLKDLAMVSSDDSLLYSDLSLALDYMNSNNSVVHSASGAIVSIGIAISIVILACKVSGRIEIPGGEIQLRSELPQNISEVIKPFSVIGEAAVKAIGEEIGAARQCKRKP